MKTSGFCAVSAVLEGGCADQDQGCGYCISIFCRLDSVAWGLAAFLTEELIKFASELREALLYKRKM